MFRFLLKKTFFKSWDNLSQILIMNIVSVFSLLGCVAALHYSQNLQIYFIALIITGCFIIFSFLMFGFTEIEILWSDGMKSWKKGFKTALSGHIPHVIHIALIWSTIVLSITFVIPFYLQAATTIYWIMACVIFWVILFGFPCLQFYIPLALKLPEEKPSAILKRCFAIFMDNKALTLLITVRSIADIAVSIFSCGLVPGFSGIALNCNEALMVIVTRHNYCENNNIPRDKADYRDIFQEDIQILSKRTLRSIIFPWKS